MLSRFNAGCDCDCCIVYRSEFCKNWYESVFERKYFGSITGNPSTMNLNAGSFDQLGVFTEEDTKIWQIRNDACGSNLSTCDTSTDPKGYTYSADHYLTPTGNVAGSYLSTLIIAEKFQWWMYTFWDTCDSTDGSHCWDSSASEPVSNQIMIFMFDYIDKDNWTGLQVEYKPDFNVSPGQVQRNFEARGRQSVSGTVSNITDVIAIDLGLGDTKINVGIEINADQRTECGTDPFVNIDFGGVDIGFSYTSLNGDRIGIVQSSPSGVVDSLTCGSDSYTVGAGFGIYNWVHQYLESEKTGCAEYSKECCDCYVPTEIDVTFSGFTECDACLDLNNTFTLINNQGSGLGCTHWGYDFDAYSPPSCTVELYGRDCELNIKRLTIDLLNNKFTLRIIAQIFIESQFGSGNACDYFIWEHTEGTQTPPPCKLTTSDSWSYIENNSSNQRCEDLIGVNYVYFNLDDFCNTGYTVTVENG